VFIKHAKLAGERDFGFVDWMGHDFSMRGMSGIEDAIMSGMGHLLSFSGTDTVPAILAAREYYGADLSVGGSVPATEHSVMSAGLQDGELETFRRLIEDVYPSGIVSIVSDTWDLWKVLTEYIPALKETIWARNGKLVIRPDSGDPVNIICGDQHAPPDSPQFWGTMGLLKQHLGCHTVDFGKSSNFQMIRGAGAIYGDSITVERADEILRRMIVDHNLSPYNMVFGIGSYAYEYVTRDTYGWAMKATAVRRGDKVVPIFKKPVTDDGTKFSHKGILAAYRTEESTDDNPDWFIQQEATEDQLANCAYEKVFQNGELLIDPSFDVIRKRVRS
jgi:nicotinamide phosphoribosyltransferase